MNDFKVYDGYGNAVYEPFDRQIEFHQCPALYRLYGGAKGGGKSFTLLWEAIITCLRIPGCNVLLLRRKFSDLEKGLLDHFRKYVPPALYGGEQNFNQSKYVVRFPNGSNLFFGHCQHPGDERQYNGHEYVFIGIDELTEWTFSMWSFLTAQVRCPIKYDINGSPVRPCMAGATNPGGPGHGWVKNLFIEHKPAPGQEPNSYKPHHYAFIKSTIDDNPVYRDTDYKERLAALPTALRKAWIEGNWDVLSGQYFDVFNQGRNTIPHNVAKSWIKPWWPKWIAIDWGFAHYTSILWFTRGEVEFKDVDGHPFRKNITLTYRELAINRTSERALAEEIVTYTNLNPQDQHYEKISNIYLSHDAFNTNRYGDPIATMIGDVLTRYKLPTPTKIEAGSNTRAPGWRKMYQLLESEEWYVSHNCPQLIDAIPQLMRSEDKPEDVVKTDQMYDDIADCARYGLVMELGTAQMPFEAQVQERFAALESDYRLEDLPEDELAAAMTLMNQRKYMTHLQMADRYRKRSMKSFNLRRKR